MPYLVLMQGAAKLSVLKLGPGERGGKEMSGDEMRCVAEQHREKKVRRGMMQDG